MEKQKAFNNVMIIFVTLVATCVIHCFGENKYSQLANEHFKSQYTDEQNVDMRSINKPFRMAKLNLLWTKAQIRLTEPKLKSLYSELKVQDKEELTWKSLKADGKDKDGLKEAQLRKKFLGIMSMYGLLEHFEDVHDPVKVKDHDHLSRDKSDSYMNKSLFKDKKLNKLWTKAETSGFTAAELQALKEEFLHHQEKVDQYYAVLKEVEKGDQDSEKNSIDEKLDKFNEINVLDEAELLDENKDYLKKVNNLREKYVVLRDDFDHLYLRVISGSKNQDFIEPKVQGLWKLATKANFTASELESLKTELFHYEKRLIKLRDMQVDAALEEQRKSKIPRDKTADKTEEIIKKYIRKVAKLHSDIESKILERHVEL